MNTGVDVLAVMDAAQCALEIDARREQAAEINEARAAFAELIEAAGELRTSLSLTRSNVMTEIKRGRTQWDGVPELLQERIDVFDAALARVKGD